MLRESVQAKQRPDRVGPGTSGITLFGVWNCAIYLALLPHHCILDFVLPRFLEILKNVRQRFRDLRTGAGRCVGDGRDASERFSPHPVRYFALF